MRALLLLSLILTFQACKQSDLVVVAPQLPNCTPANLPTARLTKKITEQPYSGTFSGSIWDTTLYAYNAAGQLKSIQYDSYLQEIFYRPDGKVDFVKKSKYHPNGGYHVTQFFYNNDLLSKTVGLAYNSDGSLAYQSLVKNFQVDTNGVVRTYWIDQSDDETVFSYDACGNMVKTQRFYFNTGAEHYLGVAEYDQYFNPEYLIGMDKVEPGYYSPNNQTVTQIVHWDCADYDSTPVVVNYTYNSEGLPITATNSQRNTWYYYD